MFVISCFRVFFFMDDTLVSNNTPFRVITYHGSLTVQSYGRQLHISTKRTIQLFKLTFFGLILIPKDLVGSSMIGRLSE